MKEIQPFLDAVAKWASSREDLHAIALVGSYARNAASEDSDIDLILLTENPERYLTNTGWVGFFGVCEKQSLEYYGKVTSLRIWYTDGWEVEYGIAGLNWAMPLDEGSREVIEKGMKIIFERQPLLSPYLKRS